MKVKTVGYNGAFNKRATIFSDDPQNPKSSVTVKARIRPIISVKPRSVSLSGFKGEEIAREITITAHEALPLKLTPVGFSVSDKADYEIETVEEGRVFRLIFRNKLNEKGKYRGILQLKTNYPEKPLLKIWIYGEMKGGLQVTPERVHLLD